MMKQTSTSGTGSWLVRTGLGRIGVASLFCAGRALAQDEPPSKASCAQAYESSQESRAAGHLQETQKRLSVCARPECPSFVQKDCARWLEEVDRELPSVLVSAPDLDPEIASSVSIAIDGNAVPGALGGTAVKLDPGRHELVAESPGRPPVKRIIMAQQGVQNREVALDFGAIASSSPSAPAPLDTGAESSTSLRPYAYVAWGIGAVGLGMFAVLGTLGRADEQGLKDDCPGATPDASQVGPGVCLRATADDRKAIYEREFTFADVGLVTGIMGAAAGTVLFIISAPESPSTSGSEGAARLHLDMAPTVGGGFASVAGAF
jgi:hypothetical protein